MAFKEPLETPFHERFFILFPCPAICEESFVRKKRFLDEMMKVTPQKKILCHVSVVSEAGSPILLDGVVYDVKRLLWGFQGI
ncbi:hypothetical protein [uncultured Methanofollis sp.]|uniref:hypothetical protein n=1 Tax=uncultured Methanofollis sp. TaxID=262500 RepID=UPI00263783AF|nr:hypothetical protein [uncultured Methanofollis sp.]